MLDLHITGEVEPIGTTARHPFWSVDRGGWVAAGDLNRGEKLRTFDGTVTVGRIEERPDTDTVFNLEIHGEHTFFVAGAKLWVHNSCTIVPKRIRTIFGPGGGGAAYLAPDGTAYVGYHHMQLQRHLKSKGLWRSMDNPGEAGWFYGIVDNAGKFIGDPI